MLYQPMSSGGVRIPQDVINAIEDRMNAGRFSYPKLEAIAKETLSRHRLVSLTYPVCQRLMQRARRQGHIRRIGVNKNGFAVYEPVETVQLFKESA